MANKRDNEFFTQEEKAYVDGLRAQAQAGTLSWNDANKQAETIRAKYGYSGGADGSGYTETYGGSGFDNQYFSQDQLRQAANIRVESLLGNVSNDSAHSFVEQLRNGYGYSGGADGSQYVASPELGYQQELKKMLDQLQSQQMPSYDSSGWDSIANKLAQAALDMKYEDWTKSDQYSSLANRYGQQGKMAMQNVLGQLASRTGGLASSYAITASQQQYNDYMAKLEEAARQMYGVERGELIENAQLAQSKGDSEYKRYIDSLNQYNTDRGYAFDLINSLMGYEQYQDETAYNRNQYETEYNDEMSLNKAKTLAAAGDFSGYKALGYSDAEIATMKKAYDAEMAASTSRSSSSGSGGTGASSGSSSSGIVDKMLSFGNDAKAYEYLASQGMSNAKTDQFWSFYEQAKAGSQSTDTQQVSTFAKQIESAAGSSGVGEGNEKWISRYVQEQILAGNVSKEVAEAALRKLGFDIE